MFKGSKGFETGERGVKEMRGVWKGFKECERGVRLAGV